MQNGFKKTKFCNFYKNTFIKTNFLQSSVIFKVQIVVKAFDNYYRNNSWKHAQKFRRY